MEIDTKKLQEQVMLDATKSYYQKQIKKLTILIIIVVTLMIGSISNITFIFLKENRRIKNELVDKYKTQISTLEKEKKDILDTAFTVKNHLIDQYYITDRQQYEHFVLRSAKYIKSVYDQSKIKKTNQLSKKELINVLDLVYKASKLVGIDPYLIIAVMAVESSFNKHAISKAGAIGLMQLMPYTAKLLANNPSNYPILITTKYHHKFLFDPMNNVKVGIRYLKDLFEIFDGRVDWTLLAYNYGPYYVKKFLYQKNENVTDLDDEYTEYPSKVIDILNEIRGE